MVGGAWPFLVGGVICLVNSVNERDLSLLTSSIYPLVIAGRCLRVVRLCSPLRVRRGADFQRAWRAFLDRFGS